MCSMRFILLYSFYSVYSGCVSSTTSIGNFQQDIIQILQLKGLFQCKFQLRSECYMLTKQVIHSETQ